MRRRVTAVALALAASAVLVGCSSSPAEDLLERPAGPADAVPEWADFGHDPDSTRLLGEHDGVSYFLAETGSVRPDDTLCLVAVAEEPVAMSSCSGGRGGVGGSGSGLGSWQFEPGGVLTDLVDDGWVLVHPTLAVRD